MERLTIRTPKGAAVKMGEPANEAEARKMLMDNFHKVCEKLAHYEDLEEAGRLVVLPCKVGDTVYQILQKGSGHWEEDKYILDDRGMPKIYERGFHLILLNDIGKTVFLTHKEAEAALKWVE